MVELLAAGNEEEVHPALMALIANEAKIDGDRADDHDSTWVKVTLPDGTVVQKEVPSD
jgi:hypothetical protein